MKRKDFKSNEKEYQEKEYANDIVFARYINYMRKALLNRRLNYLRHKKYLLEKEISVSNEEWERLSNEDKSAHSFFSEENYEEEDIKKSVGKLTEKQKEVIILYYYKNKKIKSNSRRNEYEWKCSKTVEIESNY